MKKWLMTAGLVTTFFLSGCEVIEKIQTDTPDVVIGETEENIATIQETETVSVVHPVTVNEQLEVTLATNYGIPKGRMNDWQFTVGTPIALEVGVKEVPEAFDIRVVGLYADVSISSEYAGMSGIRQDSMVLDYSNLSEGGLMIDQKNSFSMPFQVEGILQNTTSMTIINGHGSSSTTRVKESSFREYCQGANLSVVWTVLVTEKETNKTYGKTISDVIFLPSRENVEE